MHTTASLPLCIQSLRLVSPSYTPSCLPLAHARAQPPIPGLVRRRPLCQGKDSVQLVGMEFNGTFQNRYGRYRHNDIIGKPYGSTVRHGSHVCNV